MSMMRIRVRMMHSDEEAADGSIIAYVAWRDVCVVEGTMNV